MKKLALALLWVVASTFVACEPDLADARQGFGPSSSSIALSADESQIFVASEDHNALLVLNRSDKAVKARIPLAAGPAHVAVLSDGRVAVTSRYGNVLSLVDVAARKVVSEIAVGTEPMGLTVLDNGDIAVALSGDAEIAVVNVDNATVINRIAVPDADPRAIAKLPSGDLYVTHMSAGTVSRIDMSARTAYRVSVETPTANGDRLVPEHLRSITVDENSGAVVMAHTQANPDVERSPIGEDGSSNCGYGGCPEEIGATTPAITEVDTTTDTVVVPPMPSREGISQDDIDMGVAVAPPAPPSVLNPNGMRFVDNGVILANPVAVGLFAGGQAELIVNLGTQNVVAVRRHLDGSAQDVLGVAQIGHGASGLAMSRDGTRAFVWNQFDGSVSEIELPTFDNAVPSSRVGGQGQVVTHEGFGVVPTLAAKTTPVVEDALPANVSRGRKLFTTATDSRISAAGTVSCAVCHPDGRTDNQTWQFVFGPRNTPQLGGDILDTAPFHWPGDVPDVAALNNMTVLPFMGGGGLEATAFADIAAFMGTIKAAPTKAKVTNQLSALEARGKVLFESEATGCMECHSGEHFTDNIGYDVGTKSDARDIAIFQTPVLHGLARSAPYLHDGKHKSLSDFVEQEVRTNKMGRGAQLSDADAEALVAYLKSI